VAIYELRALIGARDKLTYTAIDIFAQKYVSQLPAWSISGVYDRPTKRSPESHHMLTSSLCEHAADDSWLYLATGWAYSLPDGLSLWRYCRLCIPHY